MHQDGEVLTPLAHSVCTGMHTSHKPPLLHTGAPEPPPHTLLLHFTIHMSDTLTCTQESKFSTHSPMHTHSTLKPSTTPRSTVTLKMYTPHNTQCMSHHIANTHTASYTLRPVPTHRVNTALHAPHTHALEVLCVQAKALSVHILAFISLLTYVFTRNLGSKWIPTEHAL